MDSFFAEFTETGKVDKKFAVFDLRQIFPGDSDCCDPVFLLVDSDIDFCPGVPTVIKTKFSGCVPQIGD